MHYQSHSKGMTEKEKLLLYLTTNLENEGNNLNVDSLFKILQDKLSWEKYNEIKRLCVTENFISENDHITLKDLGKQRIESIKDELRKENEKLKREKDLMELQIKLAGSNLESNRVSNKTSRVSMYIGIITLISLVTQICISLYLDKQQTKEESLEEELKSKIKELTVFHRQIDSLKILLSNHNHTKKENEGMIKSSKKN